jgi:hypothetical protein
MAVPRTRLSLALAAGVFALALADCSSSGASSGGSGGASDAAASAPAAAAGGAKAPDGTQKSQTQAGDAPAAAVKQRVIRTAHVVVRVDGELAPAAAKVRAITEGLGGTVASETTTFADTGDPGTTTSGSDPSASPDAGSPAPSVTSPAGASGAAAHPGQSLLVLRVPESSLDQALTQLTGSAGVGKELSRSGSAQDVTGDIADLQSRVATQRASVERIRALMGKAGSLQDVVLLESEVTKREADLEALEARRAALADRADLATLTVDLRTAAAVAAPASEKKRNAFLEGLDSGWEALVKSMTVVLTVLGALLPLAIVLVLVGGPLLWVLRRRRRPGPPPAPAPSPGAGS